MHRLRDVLAGRYELTDVLGRGGMGVVYCADDRVLGRTVAVKVLPHDRASDPGMIERFQREALAAAALSHPNIVAVFDTGEADETHYIVMEHVDGQSLAERVRQGPLPPDEVVRIGTQMASALAAAHDAGIVHRDVKPANAMLDKHGVVKVLDFGIARANATTTLTAASVVLGSAPYLAPEVSRGETADARSDIYALGCVLYELLTGRRPFTGDVPAAIMHQHQSATPRPPSELTGAVPPGLEQLILRMLAKDPDVRPQTARELVTALPASLNDATVVTAPLARDPSTTPMRIHGRRRQLSRYERRALAAAALLVIVGLAVALLGSSGPSPRPSGTSRAAARHSTPRPSSGGASQSTTASHSSVAPPTTVAQAARALSTVTAQDVQAGSIDRAAADMITSHLQDTLTAYDGGHASDALQHLQDLTQQVAQLAAHGDIKPAALPGLNAAIGTLGGLLQRAAATSSTQPQPGPPPGHGKDHGKGHGNGKGKGGDD